MTFLQPFMLWGLLAAALPIVIHLLNRLRYRSVRWAAMMFLIKAARSSTHHARLRHYLILLTRSLVLGCFALALCRPLIGGWLGSTLAGPPDTIIILLDRSASMEATDPRHQLSKRERALKLFGEVAEEIVKGSHFVLLENVHREPRDIASPSVLSSLQLTEATHTAADIPGMFRTAIDYMEDHRTGRTEIWLASDLQESNWRPESSQWNSLAARANALPQDIKVRLLALAEPAALNATISMRRLARRTRDGETFIDLALLLTRTLRGDRSLPITTVINENRSRETVELPGHQLFAHRTVKLESDEPTWGHLEIPADENETDNTCYFASAPQRQQVSYVVSQDPAASRYFQLAAAPAPELLNQSATPLSPAETTSISWNDASLVVWHHTAPDDGTLGAMESFVQGGGRVLLAPPAAPLANTNSILGLTWSPVEEAQEDAPYAVGVWDEFEGPLARTAEGQDLPIARAAFQKRCLPVISANDDEARDDAPVWHVAASFADGQPFLVRRRIGQGQVFAIASLPTPEWSSLHDGRVLVPMVQRLVQSGAMRLSSAEQQVCGEWIPPEGEFPQPIDPPDADFTRHAGVYRLGERFIVLNRPSQEDSPEIVPVDQAESLFDPLPASVLSDQRLQNGDKLQTEIWNLFVYLALCGLAIESALLLEEHFSRRRNEHNGLRGAKREGGAS